MEGGSFDSLPDDMRTYILDNKTSDFKTLKAHILFIRAHAQLTLTRIARGMRVRTILARARRLMRGRPLRNIPLSLQR
jgi:hypothetical protein